MAVEVQFRAGILRLDTVGAMRSVPIEPMPSDPTGPLDAAGLWVEVRDTTNRVVYRRILHDSGDLMEGPGDRLDSFVNVSTGQRPPLYVIVPHVPGGRVVLISSERRGERAMMSAEAVIPAVI